MGKLFIIFQNKNMQMVLLVERGNHHLVKGNNAYNYFVPNTSSLKVSKILQKELSRNRMFLLVKIYDFHLDL